VLPSAVAAIATGVCLFILIRACINKRPKELTSTSLEANNYYKQISYFELVRATNSFDNDNLLGSGSFGKVFKGVLDDEQIVAIKVLDMELESVVRFAWLDTEIWSGYSPLAQIWISRH
jgi:predicted unusual protein kinase regulating ubiquinone biosynthesis (AarF/ABC1/UbiB family)